MELMEWAKLQEELLKVQLGVIRGYIKKGEPDKREGKGLQGQSRSQMSIVVNILTAIGIPLHVSEIIRRAKEQYGAELDRESVVSALTKKVKKGTLVRTGPNTFGLKEL
jgi:hypothetical protein